MALELGEAFENRRVGTGVADGAAAGSGDCPHGLFDLSRCYRLPDEVARASVKVEGHEVGRLVLRRPALDAFVAANVERAGGIQRRRFGGLGTDVRPRCLSLTRMAAALPNGSAFDLRGPAPMVEARPRPPP